MAYRVDIKRSAAKELAALPVKLRARVDERILELGTSPRASGAIKLAGPDDLYRVRVGDVRILYTIRDEVLVVLVVKVAHRRDVYRRL
jgi:mRNA interferase RelE/StbE